MCVYPLKETEIKIPYYNLTISNYHHHNIAHKVLLKQTKCFRNFRNVSLDSTHQSNPTFQNNHVGYAM